MTTVTVQIPSEYEATVRAWAERNNSTVDAVVQDIVLDAVTHRSKNQAAIEVLHSFLEEDEEEQRDTLQYLRKS